MHWGRSPRSKGTRNWLQNKGEREGSPNLGSWRRVFGTGFATLRYGAPSSGPALFFEKAIRTHRRAALMWL